MQRKFRSWAEKGFEGNQLDQPTLALMQERGVAPQIINMIQPAIDNVLG